MLINKLGDLIVRPSAMETSIRLVPCSGSVQQHLLTSYLQSLLAVLVAQFTNKKMKGGMAGVVQLAKESLPLKVQPSLLTQFQSRYPSHINSVTACFFCPSSGSFLRRRVPAAANALALQVKLGFPIIIVPGLLAVRVSIQISELVRYLRT